MTLVVFTDLDGTLLDHHSYSFDAARPALARLRRLSVPVVLASSKTAAEIAPLQAQIGLTGQPAIVENGAGLLGGSEPPCYAQIRAALDTLPSALRAGFEGFGDMTDLRVAEVTGLSAQAAAQARQRQFSEPGLWHGAQLTGFLEALAAQGVHGRRGGRFVTLSLGRTKADAMATLSRTLGATHVLALGDAPNDAEMLAQADHGIVIANPDAPPLRLPNGASITRSALSGPFGWNAEVTAYLDALGFGDPDG